MKRSIAASCLAVCLILCPAFGIKSHGNTVTKYRPGEVIIKFSRTCTADDASEILAALGAKVKYRFRLFEAEYWTLGTVTVEEAIERYGSDPRIEYIEPNFRIYLDSTYPNDPRFAELWGMYNRGEVTGRADADIDATDAWDIETGAGVIVGVCDGGVDFTHEDLAANIYVNPNEIPGNGIDDDHNGFIDDVHGWDFGDNDNDPMDDFGHGTHVAGTIAAVGNNGIGVAGVSWNARILPLKIVDSEGGGFTYPAARAIEYAVMMGARVTNHSWGTSNPSQTLNNAIAAAEAAGLLTVASAGNAGVELNDLYQHYPAGLPNDGIVSVANTTRDDYLAPSSNWSGVNVDLAAPGSAILSTTPGNKYESFTGTSMSAPHVTGAISLIWSHAPYLSAMEVKQLLMATVDSLPDLVGTTVSGGRLNIHRALAALDTEAPAAVNDLAASLAGTTTAGLSWTASGDDGSVGKAKRYEVRYSTQIIDEGSFAASTLVLDPPIPQPAGSPETLTVPNLGYGTTCYFALRVFDAHGNASPLSNVAVVTTGAANPPPAATVTPASLVKTLVTGARATKELSITNSGTGDLEWMIHVLDGGYIPGFAVDRGGIPRLVRNFESGESALFPAAGTDEGFLHGVRVVFDASHGQVQDRWDVIISDLRARGATVVVSQDPLDPPELDGTDVLWITDAPPPASITGAEVEAVAAWVRGGGGLLLEGDDDVTIELYNRILAGLGAGIEYSPVDGSPGVSTAINQHETTKDVTAILFDQNGSHLSRTDAPSEVLIYDSSGIPAAAAAEIGSGRVVAIADELGDDIRSETEDNRHFANRVFGWLAGSFWVAADPMFGITQPGGGSIVDVLFDARGRPGGIYNASFILETNDPLAPNIPVDITLGVTAVPDISVSHSTIDFGVVFTSVTDSMTLSVHNGGWDTLTVYDVDVSGADFSVDITSCTLPPDEGRGIVVTVSPTSAGTSTGTITIFSNDPDNGHIIIPLSAQAFDPPVVSVSPDSMHETLFGDEIVSRALTLSNEGEYDLEFVVTVEDANVVPVSHAGAALPDPDGRNTCSVPQDELLPGYPADDRPPADNPPAAYRADRASGPVIFADDFEDGDFEGWEIRGEGNKEVTNKAAAGGTVYSYHEFNSPAGHFNGVIREFTPSHPKYIAFYIRPGATDQADGYVVLAGSDKRFIAYVYCSSGGSLCVNAGQPDQDCSIAYDPLRWYFVELKNIDFDTRTFDYYVDLLLIKTGIAFMGPSDDIAAMLLYNYSQGAQAWWDEIVVATENVVTWLTAEPFSGVVEPHSSLDVTMKFDATKLLSGPHGRSIIVASNDPITPAVRVPASVDVTAAPNMVLSDTLLAFDETIVGSSRALSLVIINRSVELPLVVGSISINNPTFRTGTASAVLPPNGRMDVVVTFAPDVHGPASGTMVIDSDDRDQPLQEVALSGMGVDAPVLSVAPDSLFVPVDAGFAAVETVLVGNAAANPDAADLKFSLWIDDDSPMEWVTVTPRIGSIAPGSTAVITAVFDATNLVAGDYPADIVASVNIPDNRIQIAARTLLRVRGTATMVLADSLDFDTVYLGFPVTKNLSVKNTGTTSLDVSSVTVDRPEFDVAPDVFSVSPGGNTHVDVTFTPSVVGAISATLYVVSNDNSADTSTVALVANVIEAPTAWVSADSISVSVRQGRSRREMITLRNAGATDLNWSADLSFERDLSGVSRVSQGVDVSSPETSPGNSLLDVLWYGTHGPFGSAVWTTAFSEIATAGGNVTEKTSPVDESLLSPYDVLWLGDTDHAFSDPECTVISNWVQGGGSLLLEAENPTAVLSYQRLLNAMNIPITLQSQPSPRNVVAPTWPHETTNGVSLLSAPNALALMSVVSPPAGILAVGLSGEIIAAHATVGKGRVLVVTDWLFSDMAIHTAGNKQFMRQVFGWLSGTNWLRVAPTGGVLPAGQQTSVYLDFDAGEFPPDDYRLKLDLATNDPSRPLIEVPVTMTIEPIVPREMDLSMDAGLNLRSWNVELDAESTNVILAPVMDAVESVQGFDGVGLTFDPSIPVRFNTLKTMDHLHGYWISLSRPATLTLNGVQFDHSSPLPLSSGYNLAGYFPDAPDSVAHAIESVIDHTDVVLGYDGGGLTFDPSIPPQFNTLRLMRPGYGYWIKLSAPDTLSYPSAPVTSTPGTTSNHQAQDTGGVRNNTTPVVPSTQWVSVWGDEVRIGGELIPTGTVITALDENGTTCGWCVAHHPGQFGLMAVYRDDAGTETDEGVLPGGDFTVMVGEYVFEGFTWSTMGDVIRFNDEARLQSPKDRLPLKTTLHQNFPNPFNPTTTIAYDLAENLPVTLIVYNARGERVRTLVNADQPAGRYRVSWDGQNGAGRQVASGVYFCLLKAGGVTHTRKMVLLK